MKKLLIIFLLTFNLSSLQANSQSTATSDIKSQFSIADSVSFKGKYLFEGLPFEYIEVSVQESKLYFVGGEYKGFLTPMEDKKDAFDIDGQAIFTFSRNNENKVVELKIDYQGQTFVGKKEEERAK